MTTTIDLPKVVQGLGGPIMIVTTPEISPTEQLLGVSQLPLRVMQLHSTTPELPFATRLAVFYHELMHFALWDSGLHHDFDDSTMEKICDVTGSMMARLKFRP